MLTLDNIIILSYFKIIFFNYNFLIYFMNGILTSLVTKYVNHIN